MNPMRAEMPRFDKKIEQTDRTTWPLEIGYFRLYIKNSNEYVSFVKPLFGKYPKLSGD